VLKTFLSEISTAATVREGKLGRYWNARKIISEYELMLECTFGKKIVTTQTLKLIIKFDSKKFPLINQLGWSAYKKFPRNVFVVLVMALELIFLLVIMSVVRFFI
jgi:hypothetical protein